LEFSTWVPRISSNCEIETRDKRQRQKEYIHTHRGIEEEEKVGLLWQKRRERETSKWWVFLLGEQQAIKQASRQQIERSSREIHSSSSSSSSSSFEVCGVFCFSFFFFLPGSFLARMNF
jgi:hypothetical protein